MGKLVRDNNAYFVAASFLGALLGYALGGTVCFLLCKSNVEIFSLFGNMLAVASLVFSIFSLCFNYYSSCQKRYEETFFNMLEQKRKIVEGLKMRSKVWDESDSIYRDYNANDSFIMICSEVNNIYMSLFNHGKYEKQATQNSPNEATEEIRENIDLYNDDESIRKKIKERYQCRLTNLIYDIDEVKYNKAQTVTSLEERWKGCIGLFLKKYGWSLEFYFRQIYQSLLFADKHLSNFNYYADLLKSQMTAYEVNVVNYYVLTHMKLFGGFKNKDEVKKLFGSLYKKNEDFSNNLKT